MPNQFDVKSIKGSSMALNGGGDRSAAKPVMKGTDSPGGTKPKREESAPVEMPKAMGKPQY